jgi:hypothetical protein
MVGVAAVAATWIMWFIRRFPALDSLCRTCSPDDASATLVDPAPALR